MESAAGTRNAFRRLIALRAFRSASGTPAVERRELCSLLDLTGRG